MTKVSPTWRVAVSAAAAALPSTTHHRLSPAVISTIVGTWWPSVHQRCPSACTQRVETQTSKSSVDDIATHLTHDTLSTMQGSFPPCTGIITPLTSEFPRWQIVRCVVYIRSVCTRYYRHYPAWNCLVMLNVHPQPSLAQQGGNLVFCNVHPKKILTHRQAPGHRRVVANVRG